MNKMIKLSAKSLIVALLTSISLSANAYDFEVDGIYYSITSSNNLVVAVTYYNAYSGEIIIPETVTYDAITYTVTKILDQSFVNCSGLTSINIPNSVTEIGDQAFYGCTGLTSVYIPSSVTKIGHQAFYGCTGLTSVTLPDSLYTFGEYAFRNCTGLTSVTLPSYIGSFYYGTFYGCTGLTSAILPEGLDYISRNTFYGCTGLTSIVIPDSVKTIEESAFTYTGLTSLVIPDSVKTIGNSAFRGCSSLKSLTLPVTASFTNYYTNRLKYSFDYNVITDLILTGNGEIDDYTFWNFTALQNVSISDQVTNIGSYAFYKCTSLTSAVLPESLESIGDEAFANCSSLQEVYCYATTPPSCGDGVFDNSLSDSSSSNAATRSTSSETDYTTTLYVPSGTLELYEAAAVWQDFPSIVEMGSDTAIDYINAGESAATPISYITLSGQQISEPAKGTVNIVRMSDGSLRKVLVK